jgi:hypothetical protein
MLERAMAIYVCPGPTLLAEGSPTMVWSSAANRPLIWWIKTTNDLVDVVHEKPQKAGWGQTAADISQPKQCSVGGDLAPARVGAKLLVVVGVERSGELGSRLACREDPVRVQRVELGVFDV